MVPRPQLQLVLRTRTYLGKVEALPEDRRELLLADDEVAVGDGVAEAVLRHQAVLAHVVLPRVRQDQGRHLPRVEHLRRNRRNLN